MNPRHAEVLRLIHTGTHLSTDLCQATGVSRRTMREVLRSLRDVGLVACVKTTGAEWSWVSADVENEVRRAVQASVERRKREEWARENERRKRLRRAKSLPAWLYGMAA